MPKRRRSRSLADKGTSAADAIDEGAAKKMPSGETVGLAHSLASNLQVPLWCHQGSVMEAQ